MKSIWLFIGILCFGFSLPAQRCVVKGELGGAANQPLLLYRYSAEVLEWQSPPHVVHTDENGRFRFEWEPEAQGRWFIADRSRRWQLFVRPGDSLEVILDPGDELARLHPLIDCLHMRIWEVRHKADQAWSSATAIEDTVMWGIYVQHLQERYDQYEAKEESFIRTYALFHLGYKIIEAHSRLRQGMQKADALEAELLLIYDENNPAAAHFMRLMALNRMTVDAFHPSVKGGMPVDHLLAEAPRYMRSPAAPDYLTAGLDIASANRWLDDRSKAAINALREIGRQNEDRLRARHMYRIEAMLEPGHWHPEGEEYDSTALLPSAGKWVLWLPSDFRYNLDSLQEWLRPFSGKVAIVKTTAMSSSVTWITPDGRSEYQHDLSPQAAEVWAQLVDAYVLPVLQAPDGRIRMNPAPFPGQGAAVILDFLTKEANGHD